MTGMASTETSRAAALSMFDQVPCFFQMIDDCGQPARWIAYFVHEEPGGCGQDPEPWPVCENHHKAVRHACTPFWRVWYAAQPMPCVKCAGPLRLDRFEPVSR